MTQEEHEQLCFADSLRQLATLTGEV
jgi:hypothetical protein